MCNDYEQHVKWREYCGMMQGLALGTPIEQGERDLPQADDIRIGNTGPVMRAAGNGIELAPMTFGFPPASPRSGPIFNFRSEGRHFDKSNRCLIPASAFFEFTGKKYPKAKHRFTLKGAPFMATPRRPSPCSPPIRARTFSRITRVRSWCCGPSNGPPGSTSAGPNPSCSGRFPRVRWRSRPYEPRETS